MSRFAARVSEHPVLAFFVLTYFLSWPLFFLVLVVVPQNMALQGTLGSLAVFAPALACMLVARASGPGRAGKRTAARWITFLVTWAVAWPTLVFFVIHVRDAPLGTPLVVFGGVLAILPAFTASRAFSATTGVRSYFRSLVQPRGHVVWYLVALLTFPAVQLAGLGLTQLFGLHAESDPAMDIAIDPAVAGLMFLHGFFFTGGINEECGWRGFALPALQRRFSPLAAALIVWVFWALWHLPIDVTSGDPTSSILLNRLFFNAMWSVLLMWVFNRTQGSVLAPALFHPAMNTSGALLPATDAATVLFAVLVSVVIVRERMWRRLPGGAVPTR
jgi:membrane protease YdiL (CAAX protease family)